MLIEKRLQRKQMFLMLWYGRLLVGLEKLWWRVCYASRPPKKSFKSGFCEYNLVVLVLRSVQRIAIFDTDVERGLKEVKKHWR